ncbi:FAD-dependent monooxygenase [Ramlibacter sp. AW1]|uniref:FAD-dependent monooxygenase n=1 Tax=Ramlibacter aurantiacus TaxID=2801330 RepID=A0A937D2T0_9BURK|nr:FAD-dependent monooxygenase [Ramlibacter aurantiacus]MBL0420035.1 FAD-dependent monooxygenase [Ramlibacter aurantiacus]
MESTIALPIVIAGAGVGGLAAAIALAQKGRRVLVLEQAEEIRPIGYGIQLGPNAFRMFEHLDMADAVKSRCSFPEAGVMRDIFTLEEVTRLPFGDAIQARFGQPYAVIHRTDLHAALLERCAQFEEIELRAGARLRGYEQLPDRVRVQAGSGPALDAEFLVGADGVHSTVRGQLCGTENSPRRLGYVAYRAVVERADFPEDLYENRVVLWAGPGFHFMTYPLHGGERFNIVAVFRSRRHPLGLPGAGEPEELREIFAGVHPHARRLLGFVDTSRHWDIGVMEPVPAWHDGRVALLGDAAHAMLQALAQGACQAIEDGVALAECLDAKPQDPVQALADYQRVRQPRAVRVQYESRLYWEVYHAAGPYADLRRQMLTRSDEAALESLAWLYDPVPVEAG